jgi:hypothetical protein
MQICLRGKRARVCAAAGVAGVLGFVLGVPAVAVADATPAQKVPLTQTNRACDASVLGPDKPQPFGFANIVRSASGTLVASVVLKGGPPDTTYNIRLIQVLPGDGDCGSATVFDATLTTDDRGNGNANVQETVLPGASTAWVDLNNAGNFDDYFDTVSVAF